MSSSRSAVSEHGAKALKSLATPVGPVVANSQAATSEMPADHDERRERRRLRVVLIVSGFPTADHPYRGIFNLRAVRALSIVVDLKVVHLRAWLPGRRLRKRSAVEGATVTTVAVPQLPVWQPVASVVNARLFYSVGWYAIRSILESCDLIHSVGADGAGVAAARWAHRARKHHITQVTGSDVNVVLPRIRSMFGIAGWERHLHGAACNSHALQARFVSLYPETRNVRTVPRGVDTENFSSSGPASGPLAREAPVRFFYLGGFSRHHRLGSGASIKGGPVLLMAWEAAEDTLAAAGASLLLSGDEADGGAVRQWRARLRHPERVYLLGRLAPEQVPGHIRAADVILVPSLEEGLPNVCMEAAACGRPVLGSAVGGIPEIVLDEETGVLLPAGRAEAWRDALVRFARDPGRLREMGVRARRRVEERFDSRFYAPQMLEFYRRALQLPLEGGCE